MKTVAGLVVVVLVVLAFIVWAIFYLRKEFSAARSQRVNQHRALQSAQTRANLARGKAESAQTDLFRVYLLEPKVVVALGMLDGAAQHELSRLWDETQELIAAAHGAMRPFSANIELYRTASGRTLEEYQLVEREYVDALCRIDLALASISAVERRCAQVR